MTFAGQRQVTLRAMSSSASSARLAVDPLNKRQLVSSLRALQKDGVKLAERVVRNQLLGVDPLTPVVTSLDSLVGSRSIQDNLDIHKVLSKTYRLFLELFWYQKREAPILNATRERVFKNTDTACLLFEKRGPYDIGFEYRSARAVSKLFHSAIPLWERFLPAIKGVTPAAGVQTALAMKDFFGMNAPEVWHMDLHPFRFKSLCAKTKNEWEGMIPGEYRGEERTAASLVLDGIWLNSSEEERTIHLALMCEDLLEIPEGRDRELLQLAIDKLKMIKNSSNIEKASLIATNYFARNGYSVPEEPLAAILKYQKTVEEMIEHDRRYYDKTAPTISDYEYDRLLTSLKEYEASYPQDTFLNSPTQRIPEAPTRGFEQKSHMVPMMSLANTYSECEVSHFIKRVEKILDRKQVDFCCELKMDGTAISLRYKNGHLFHAVTRGNGKTGDDVTANVKTIKTVPLALCGSDFPDDFEVRGEVYLSLDSFHAINQEREDLGLETFANPRNAAAGSLKLLDPSIVAKRKLDLVCYGIAEHQFSFLTQKQVHHVLKKWGLPTSDPRHIFVAHNVKEIIQFADAVQKEREKLPFQIDGIVVKVNNLTLHQILGATGKTPRHAIAYKFPPEQAETIILNIAVQLSRSGVLTPVAELKPIFLSGSTVSRATLHNQDKISRQDIRLSDVVVIEKGGDVIPKVVRVDLSQRKHQHGPWQMPKECPICHTPVVHHEQEVAVRCPNFLCEGQKVGRIIYFASEFAMDIEHMGEKVVQHLVEKKLISRISDIYSLSENDLMQLERFKEKSVDNLLKSIERSKKCSLSRLIIGLSIPFVGTEIAEDLAFETGDISVLMDMNEEELQTIKGIGKKTASGIYSFFQAAQNREEVELLLKRGVTPEVMKPNMTDIYSLSENDLMQLGGVKEKSVDNLLKSIKRSKKCPRSPFIMGLSIPLSIPFIGTETAEDLVVEIGDISILMDMKEEELQTIKGKSERTRDRNPV